MNEEERHLIRCVVDCLIECLPIHVVERFIEPDRIVHHLVRKRTMRCSKIARSCGDRDSIRGPVSNCQFGSLFVCRRSGRVDRLIEEDKRHLVVPDLTRSTTTSQCIGLRFVTGRRHSLDRRINGIFDCLFVVLHAAFLKALEVLHTGVLHPQREHTNGLLHTLQVIVGILLVLVEVQNRRAVTELMRPCDICNSSPSLTSLTWHDQVCGDIHLHSP